MILLYYYHRITLLYLFNILYLFLFCVTMTITLWLIHWYVFFRCTFILTIYETVYECVSDVMNSENFFLLWIYDPFVSIRSKCIHGNSNRFLYGYFSSKSILRKSYASILWVHNIRCAFSWNNNNVGDNVRSNNVHIIQHNIL